MNACDLEETKHMAMEKLRELMKTPEKWKEDMNGVLWCRQFFISCDNGIVIFGMVSPDGNVTVDTYYPAWCTGKPVPPSDWVEFFYDTRRKRRDQIQCEKILKALNATPKTEPVERREYTDPLGQNPEYYTRTDKPWWRFW